MPHGPRLEAPGCLHHVIARGLERRRIVVDDVDHDAFVARLAGLGAATGTEVLAWALLPNHFHLVLRTRGAPLSDFMRARNTGYAGGFNRRHRRAGDVFQNRFKSLLVEEEPCLFKSKCVIEENGKTRTFIVMSEPITKTAASIGKVIMTQTVLDSEDVKSTPLFHPFEGIVQVVDVLVHEGDSVKEGQTVAFVEAMKAKHHIKSTVEGIVTKVNVKIGDEINSTTPIMIIN